jgi:hypothetical protein
MKEKRNPLPPELEQRTADNKSDFETECFPKQENVFEKFMYISFGVLALSCSFTVILMTIIGLIAFAEKFN